MQGDVSLGGIHAVIIFAGLVVGVRRHDQRFARPLRIRVLTIDFLEFLDRVSCVLLRIEKIETFVVEPISGLVWRRVLLFGEKVETTASAERPCQQCDGQEPRGTRPGRRFWRRGHASGTFSQSVVCHEDLNTNLPTRTCCFPRSATLQARPSAPVLPKTRALAMRLSRHSARIKAKVKAKSLDFQDTSGP